MTLLISKIELCLSLFLQRSFVLFTEVINLSELNKIDKILREEKICRLLAPRIDRS